MTETDIQSVLMIAALVAVPLGLLIFIIRRRMARGVESQLRGISQHVLHDFLLPDGNGGEIHLEYAMLTTEGILVIDTKDVEGNVFGSDAMDEWTVIDDNTRFTFRNPQRGLLDRVAAVKALAPDVPVNGYIAFSERGRFSKGQPSNVVFFNSLIVELKDSMPEQSARVLEAFLPAWDKLVSLATVKGVDQALKL